MVYLVLIHIPVAQEKHLSKIIKYLQNEHGSKNCTLSETKTHFEINCRISPSYLSEVLEKLEVLGVGVDFGIIDVVDLTLSVPTIEKTRHKGFRQNGLPLRLIRSMVSGGAGLSVDYCLYVFVASCLAGIGLATNNAVTIVASMLVSPLMVPLSALCFGVLMLDSRLFLKAAISEAVGLALCFLTGMFVALLTVPFTGEKSGFITQFEWPNSEMLNRGTYASLFTGLFVAIPSGIGVPLSMMSNNINSLVGVAISAALLPPIVNSAMNFVFGTIGPWLNPNNISTELAQQGLGIASYSMALFIENLLIILFFSIILLKLKKVGPLRRASKLYQSLPSLTAYGALEEDGELSNSNGDSEEAWTKAKSEEYNKLYQIEKSDEDRKMREEAIV